MAASTPDTQVQEWVAYLRKSKGHAGIDRQRRDVQVLLQRRGGRVIEEIVDIDATAFSKPGQQRAHRDGYQKMLDLLRTERGGPPLGILAWHADRLHRNPAEVEDFIAICAAGQHPVETVRSGGYELWTPTGRKRLRADANEAAYEVEHLIDRVTAAMEELAREGRWKGGQVPFGYRLETDDDGMRVLRPHPEEAEAVRWGTIAVLQGFSLGHIAREWNRRGLKNRAGRPWIPSNVRRVLLRASNAGLRVHRGEIFETSLEGGKAAWEPLVSEELWKAASGILVDPDRRTQLGVTPKWFGSGLYLCGVCRAPLSIGSSRALKRDGSGKYRNSYRCRRSGKHTSRDAENLDAYVEKVLFARLRRPDLLRLITEETPPDLAGMRARLETEEKELAAWRRLAKEGKVSAVAFAESEQGVLSRIRSIKAEMVAAVRSPVLADLVGIEDIEAVWETKRDDAAGLAWRRAVLQELVTVVVYPAKRGKPKGWRPGEPAFDWESIGLEWRLPRGT
ncbi:recombinase family protein [Actinomadura viridis]|uniref:DNA invertase Pin-like site-specific DNA recombinase n=1 Tax=Actinomadura viridis TaxID=58110 RepID=A0A931DH52_9ACTN|nr:recombinase family protein [Actinomadura viridis]MBG6089980.1 DNA invertase Pin-like site-specific DNA recombinase [Actinomadura viridis]